MYSEKGISAFGHPIRASCSAVPLRPGSAGSTPLARPVSSFYCECPGFIPTAHGLHYIVWLSFFFFFFCRRDVKLVHELYFPLQPSKDVPFEIGRIFMGLKDFDSAAELFRFVGTVLIPLGLDMFILYYYTAPI